MDKLSAMRVFLEATDRGSVSAAARQLNMSRAMATRYLAFLEQWTGARLLHRTTRRLNLTTAGKEVLPLCRDMLAIEGRIATLSNESSAQPRGGLRMTASAAFAQTHLVEAVVDYLAQYPSVAVDLEVVDRIVDLVDERIDLAIRITNEPDANLIARKLGHCLCTITASPKYIAQHGKPTKPQDLARHNCLTSANFGESTWHFTFAGERISVPVEGNLSANETMVLLRAATAGAGIAMLPTFVAEPAIKSGELVLLLEDHHVVDLSIYAVYASRRQMPLSVRTMLDFLAERFRHAPWAQLPK